MGNDVHSELRYVGARRVEHPFGTLEGVRLSSGDGELGRVAGVLVEPTTRRVRYYVVEQTSLLKSRLYLLAADSPAILEAAERTIRVEAGQGDLTRFDLRSVQRFSDRDLIEAMFARPAA